MSRGRTRRRDSGVTPRTPAEGAHTCTQEHGEILGRPQTAWREAAPAPRLQVCRAELNHKGALPSHYEGRSGEEEEKPGRPLPQTAAAAITGLHTQRLSAPSTRRRSTRWRLKDSFGGCDPHLLSCVLPFLLNAGKRGRLPSQPGDTNARSPGSTRVGVGGGLDILLGVSVPRARRLLAPPPQRPALHCYFIPQQPRGKDNNRRGGGGKYKTK